MPHGALKAPAGRVDLNGARHALDGPLYRLVRPCGAGLLPCASDGPQAEQGEGRGLGDRWGCRSLDVSQDLCLSQ